MSDKPRSIRPKAVSADGGHVCHLSAGLDVWPDVVCGNYGGPDSYEALTVSQGLVTCVACLQLIGG